MFAKSTILNLVAATAFAAPTPDNALTKDATPYVFSVSRFSSVCTAATCYYGFNVSATEGPSGEPSFTATGCGGSSVDPFKPCSTIGIDVPGNVETKEENLGRDVGANVFVKLSWRKDNIAYTLTGNQTVQHTGIDKEPFDFVITPKTITAVPDKA
ncbi:hypothetical protein CC80DRAFT_496657 [Byssothecium circinans]|uniref:Hypersensitive response-inducing protein n=1 Tax=Byssothecium circinans TaxID=147558 RepID=A0A6A5TG53_9PLEO|nr:hypothetical protein CC80DRAFT_496657 [Byssothecium circinans]